MKLRGKEGERRRVRQIGGGSADDDTSSRWQVANVLAAVEVRGSSRASMTETLDHAVSLCPTMAKNGHRCASSS